MQSYVQSCAMKDDYSFKYNAFGNTVLVFVSIAVAFVVLAFGTLPVAFAVIAAEVVLFYYLCQHTYLTIDSEGIQLNMFISNDEYLPWNEVGGYCKDVTMGSGRFSQDGIGIYRKGYRTSDDSEQYNSDVHAMFIPKNYVHATTDDVAKALDEYMGRYVNGKRRTKRRDMTLAGWDDPAATQRKVSTALWLLFVLWLLAFAYTANTCMNIILGDNGHLVRRSLTNVGDYEDSLYFLFTAAFIVLYLLPNMIVKKHYVLGTIGLLIAMGITITHGYKTIPALQFLYANCTEPTQDKVQCIEGKVSRIHSGKSSYTAYKFIYESKTYDIEEDYLSKAKKGMKAKVYIQKGSRGIPIVQDIEIPAIGWSLTKGYYAPKEQYTAEHVAQEAIKPKITKRETAAQDNQQSSNWKNSDSKWPFTNKWGVKILYVKGNDMGEWRVLAPQWPQHHFHSHYLSLHIAIQEDDGKAILLFYDEQHSSYYPADIKSVIKVEADGRTVRYNVAPGQYLSGIVWHFGPSDARKFIRQIAYSPRFTIDCVSKEDNTVKDYTFAISQDRQSD